MEKIVDSYFDFYIRSTISLFLSVFDVVKIKPTLVEFLIPITILITAVYVVSQGKKKNESLSFIGFVTLFLNNSWSRIFRLF
jgi:phosphatidylglycerophosphate synthase